MSSCQDKNSVSDVPNELALAILEETGYKTVIKVVSCLGRRWAALSKDHYLWRCIARQAGLYLGKKKRSTAQLQREVDAYPKQVERRLRNLSFQGDVDDRDVAIQTLFMDGVTAENSKRAGELLDARDLTVEWRVMAQHIDVEEPSLEGALEKEAAQYPEWFDENLDALKELAGINLSKCKLGTLSQQFVKLKGELTALDLSDNHLPALPGWMVRCKELRGLVLDNNPMNKIPTWISRFRHLTQLSAAHIGLTRLPDGLYRLKNLEVLDLSDNALTSISSEIRKLTRLVFLDLGSNDIEWLPDTMARLSLLEELNVYANPLDDLPDWIGDLEALQQLTVNYESISTQLHERLMERDVVILLSD